GNVTQMNTPSGSGWTLVASQASGQEYTRGRAWVKVAGGSEPSSYTLTQESGNYGVAVLVAIRDGATPVVAASNSAGSGNAVTTPGITPTGANDLEIRFAAADGDGTSRTFTPPSGFVEFADLNNQGFTAVQGVYRQLSSASPTGNVNHTASGTIVSRLGITIAVPAPSSGDATAEPDTVTATAAIPAPTASDGSTPPPPSPPVLRGANYAAGRTPNLVVPLPDGVTEGDVLLAAIGTDVGSINDLSISGSGWTIAQTSDPVEHDARARLWWKFAGGSEPSSYTLTQAFNADGVAIIVAIGNPDGPPVTAITPGSPDDNTVPTPGVTPSGPISIEVRWAFGLPDDAGVAWTPPAGFTELVDAQSTSYTTGTAAYRELEGD